jgi:hypothetical protein
MAPWPTHSALGSRVPAELPLCAINTWLASHQEGFGIGGCRVGHPAWPIDTPDCSVVAARASFKLLVDRRGSSTEMERKKSPLSNLKQPTDRFEIQCV